MSEQLRFSYRLQSGDWSDQTLWDELKELTKDNQEKSWMVVQWSEEQPSDGGLSIYLAAPTPDIDRATQLKLADLVKQKLSNGFRNACRERGWPLPRFQISSVTDSKNDNWTYWFQLGPHRTNPVVIHPNKILAVGEEHALSTLLGLECTDPVFGLPAKWVTYSQSERASSQGSLLFEAADVIMSHAINFTESRFAYALGTWEVNHWLSGALPSGGATTCRMLSEHGPVLLTLVKKLVGEGLYLPSPEQFCEQILLALAEADSGSLENMEPFLRKVVVSLNVPRWLTEHDELNVLEWKGPEDVESHQHHRMLRRLTQALHEAVASQNSGTPILAVSHSQREQMAEALSGLFPDLPIVAWSELSDLSNIRIISTIDSELRVDPSVLPASFFSISE